MEPAAPASFDDAILELGAFGPWQRVIFLLVSLPDVFTAFAILLPVLISATPSWHCAGANTSTLNASTSACDVAGCVPEFNGDFTSIVSEVSDVINQRRSEQRT